MLNIPNLLKLSKDRRVYQAQTLVWGNLIRVLYEIIDTKILKNITLQNHTYKNFKKFYIIKIIYYICIMKEIKKTIKLKIYGDFKVHIIISNNPCRSRNKFSKKLNGNIKENDSIDGMICYNDNNPFDSYIFLINKYRPGVIAHECFHIACYIMKNINAFLDDSSEESYAYMITYLVENITKLYDKKL